MIKIARDITFAFQKGGPAFLDVKSGRIIFRPTQLDLLAPPIELPEEQSFPFTNGEGVATGIEPTSEVGSQGNPPWAYLVIVAGSNGNGWEYLVGVPDGTDPIPFLSLPRYFVNPIPKPNNGNAARGPRGDKGEKGDRGADGAQGIQGIQGVKGEQGERGFQGLQGEQGLSGAQGIPGVRGLQGLQGAKGDTGEQGVQGLEGPQGSAGATGSVGPQGDVGADGAQGPQGLRGVPGVQGVQGIQGPQGIRGFGVPTGGLPGQVLTKTGPGDNDTSWRGQRVTVSGNVDVGTTLTAIFGSFRINVKITVAGGSAVLELKPATAGTTFVADYGSVGSGEKEGDQPYSRFRRASNISDSIANNISPTANYTTFSVGRGGASPELWIGSCLVPKAGYSYLTVERIL